MKIKRYERLFEKSDSIILWESKDGGEALVKRYDSVLGRKYFKDRNGVFVFVIEYNDRYNSDFPILYNNLPLEYPGMPLKFAYDAPFKYSGKVKTVYEEVVEKYIYGTEAIKDDGSLDAYREDIKEAKADIHNKHLKIYVSNKYGKTNTRLINPIVE